ncbi:MAG TPA: phosphatase PAP2 family protein [Bryobacteraceae bacterium]|nr:phosphatase PAP2 family protein [Bryobacteraceae bacterium]
MTAALLPLRAQDLAGGVVDDLAIAAEEATQNQPSSSSADQNIPNAAHPNPLRDARDRIYYPGDTESVKPLTRKLVLNILLDQKEIWTSPFHMHAADSLWWIGFGGVTAALVATDHRTSRLLENSKGQVAWGNNISKIGAGYTLVPVVAGFYAFGAITDDPKARETGVLGTEALVDSVIVSSILKPIAGRNRPNAAKEDGQFFDGGASFPSGHAISSWALASVISYEYGHTKFVPIVACGLASVVSVARFGARQHFASDIVAGGAMGWFIGRYVWKTHQDHAIHNHGLQAQVIPQFAPASHTYGVALSLSK